MGDQPSYADPIIIPITITIPDPRPQPDTDRWGQLGRSIPPRFDNEGGVRRQEPAAGLEAVQASAMQRRRYDLLATVLPDPPPSRLQETLDAMLRRAEQRAAYARGEIEQGDYGSAAGHLLLGRPFPASVDDPSPPIVHNEANEENDPRAAQPGPDVKTTTTTADKHPSTPIGRRSLPVRVPNGTNEVIAAINK